jgi:integrase
MQSKPVKPNSATVISLNDARTRRVDLNRGTVQEAWDCYLASQALEQLKTPSRRTYEQAAREAIAALPPRPAAGDVTLWLESIVRDGRAPATANKMLRCLKAITERATLVMRGGNLALRNAFKQQRPFRLAARERRDASHDTVARLLELTATPCERLAVLFAAFYGLRAGEILGLQPGDVRRDGMTRIRVVRTRDTHGVRDRKNAKNGKPHVITLNEETKILTLVLCDEKARRELAHPMQREIAHTWLLPWGTGHMAKLMNKWREDERVVLPMGDAWHALRHYGATVLVTRGKNVGQVQAWLGDSTQTAAQCYMGQVRGTTEGTADDIFDAFNERKGADDCSSDAGGTRGASKTPQAPPAGTQSDSSSSHESDNSNEENP